MLLMGLLPLEMSLYPADTRHYHNYSLQFPRLSQFAYYTMIVTGLKVLQKKTPREAAFV